MTALFAGPHLHRIVESLRDRFELRNDLFGLVKLKILFVNLSVAVLTEPHTAIFLTVLPAGFDHDSDRACRSSGRVQRLGRQQKNIAFVDDDVNDFFILDRSERDGSLHLEEQFLAFIVVKVTPRVGTTHHHDNQIISGFVNAFVPNGWLEQIAIVVDPGFDVEGLFDHFKLRRMPYWVGSE